MSKKLPLVFLDVSIDGDSAEKMVFELFSDVAPKTAENFCALYTGEKGISPKTGRPLHYKGSFFHSIIKGSMAQSAILVYAVGYRADGHDCFSSDVVLRVVIFLNEMDAVYMK
ncbi:peptidyl-prolyl cis-trans isomerase CYP95-like isoform X3 [Camellia sinensis]|uniref:peptidyl-prolyl cis-trans isomerase CYP95-like isoform X3 n=1 Tax=Camellia sinensis TaxID=4442 RepID=UPI0010359001|nr:peptidyl-prolyl cis-trans isomerase CYP95-like isoform X3 [Camellia sinensis]